MPKNTNYCTTGVGSFPHVDSKQLCQRLVESLDIPAWPQLPRRSFFESMYLQYSHGLPGLVIDTKDEKITFNTNDDLLAGVEKFYERYLAEDVDSFALQNEYAEGFYGLLEIVGGTNPQWIKGQVTGPISFGLTVTDQDLRASLYNEYLTDVIVKNMAMAARWQVQQLKQLSSNVILFVDEPYMAAFGSAFISLNREEVIAMLDEVFAAIHQEGGLAGVHCCANTDWSVLMATSVDFLNLDAYGFVENLALYPQELRAFLDRGGAIAWGLIPNNEEILTATPERLAGRLQNDLTMIAEKAAARGVHIEPQEFASRSLITTSCGLGSTTVEIADKVLQVQKQTGALLQQ